MAKKYQYPALAAAVNCYEKYFDSQFRSRELDRAYSYSVLTGRGNKWLWDMIGEGETVTAAQKKHFFEGAVFVQIKNLKTKEPVYFMYVDSTFWYVSSKDRFDHDHIQSIANFHLDKLQGAIIKTTTKG